MCLAVPARILSIQDREAEIDLGGVQRTVSLWLTPDAQVGNYVYIHAGYAISVLDAEEAQESLRLLDELAASYEVEELFRSAGDNAPPITVTGPPPTLTGPLAGLETM
ncbi:MAG: HypC/HybG/HupF family hydrogenase formation chaperone [Chloroflexi bacterium]|nr:HypC/HybG/HupF family hydrogenase formation chaperone [Chloroflexota bacterium]MBU1750191.1 HypC/HybG/HupF family hydrogenase formation chaperone [Chloroflexota bacterium]MBU1879373.1 HypC/HybG/HupF family hydrogenase formation chaperone [Chloroflexota bacterium]